MEDQVEPADAARALCEIDRRREQVIRRKIFPVWFWWAHAVLVVALVADFETQSGVLLWLGIALFAAASLVIDRPVSRAARAAPPRRGLGGREAARRTLVVLVTSLVLLLGVLAAIGLGLKAAGVPYPATIAATVAAVLFAVGGPQLVRWEAAMLVRRSRRQG